MEKSKVFRVYLIYFICMTVYFGLRTASAFGAFSYMHTDISDIVYSGIIQIGVMFLLPLILYSLFVRDKSIIVNYKKRTPISFSSTFRTAQITKLINYQVIVIALALGLVAFVINMFVGTFFDGLLRYFGYQRPVGVSADYEPLFPVQVKFLLDVFTIAVLPAFCEEFMHRGILLNGTKEIGVKKAIVISSLLFALLHFNVNQFFFAFIIGLLLGLVTVVSKSIYPAMIIHFVNNFIPVYLSYADKEGWLGRGFYDSINGFLQSNNALLTFLVCLTCLTMVVVLLMWLVNKLFRIQTLDKVQKAIDSMYTSDERLIINSPIVIEKSKMLQEVLENNTTLNLNYEEMKNPLDVVLPKETNVYKPTLADNLFLISACVLGGLVTIFSFIWGLF